MAGYAVAPLFIWLIINVFMAIYLKGAAFFIVPFYFCLLLFYFVIKRQKTNSAGLAIITLPVIVILVPFLQAFPVGLGLEMVAVSALLTTLIFGLLIPVFGFYKFKRSLVLLFIVMFGFFLIRAHFSSNFNEDRQKPNSLLYVFNADENTAHWVTYDKMLDDWTKRKLGEQPENVSDLGKDKMLSKYGSVFRYAAEAPLKNIPAPRIDVVKDSLIENNRHIEICITPQRPVNRMEIFADDISDIISFSANDEKFSGSGFNKAAKKSQRLLLNYYIDGDSNYLELHVIIPKNKTLTLTINESSYDLLSNDLFTISPRSKDMIPKPFVINDAILVKKTIKL